MSVSKEEVRKLKIESMKCFEEVASVIGKENARKELFAVVEGWDDGEQAECGYNRETLVSKKFLKAFDWLATPQGYMFWDNMYEGIDPYTS